MELLLVVGLLSVLGTFSTVYCIREGDLHFSEYFDPNTGKAAGTLSCTQDNEILDISSVGYYYRDSSSTNHPCTYRCPAVTNSDTFLDGTHSVCQNENNIRSTCYARNSCHFNNIIEPQVACGGDGGDNIATHVWIHYRCIDSDYVFNLCEEREMIVTKQTQIILTSPLSSDDTYRKSSCKCVLSSLYTNQSLNQNVTLTRLRMAQLFGGDVVTYGYGYRQTTYSTPYTPHYLPKEIPIPVGQYNSKEASVKINNTNPLAGDSRVFFSIEPGKDIKINCNDAKVVVISTTRSATALAASTTSTTGDKLNTSVTAPSTSSTVRDNPSASPSGGSNVISSKGDRPTDSSMLVIIVVVVVAVLALICIVVVTVLCLAKRKRRARAEKFAVSLSENNNVEMSPLRPAGAEDTYHELEEPDERYDVIPVDGTYAEVGADVDPYKVTDLQDDPPSAANLQRTRALAANEYASHNDKVRNSRGSIDVYTENSTITEDHYSQPCDVLLKDGEEDNSATRQYDTPAEVTYAAIQKPLGKTNSVELIDNELYGT